MASSCCRGRRHILVVAAVGFVVEVDKTPWPGIKVSLSCKAQSVCQGFPHPLAGGVFAKTNSAVLDWNWNGVNSMKTAACHWQCCALHVGPRLRSGNCFKGAVCLLSPARRPLQPAPERAEDQGTSEKCCLASKTELTCHMLQFFASLRHIERTLDQMCHEEG